MGRERWTGRDKKERERQFQFQFQLLPGSWWLEKGVEPVSWLSLRVQGS